MVWDLTTGKSKKSLAENMAGMRRLALTPNGQTVAVVGLFNGVQVWDAQSGKAKAEIPAGGLFFRGATTSLDGKVLILGSYANQDGVIALELLSGAG